MLKQHYLINDETMYLIAKDNKGLIESRIGELYSESSTYKDSPNKIISINCKHHSQSYTSRKELTKVLTSTNSKLPIIIDLFGLHIFFCTHSDRIIDNNWFNIKHIHSYYGFEGKTRISFSNNEELDINISLNSFNNQYLNALKLHYRFSLQKEKAQRSEISNPYNYSRMNLNNVSRQERVGENNIDSLYLNYLASMNDRGRIK